MRRSPLLALLLAALAAPLAAQVPTPQPAAPGDSAEDATLKALFFASDERDLKLSPISAIYRGDLRYAGEPLDFFSEEKDRQREANTRADLAALARIDRSRLTRVDAIAYDVFKQQAELSLRGHAPAIRRIDRAMPIDHFNGLQTFYPEFASGKGAAPFTTVADYENNLKRNAGYAQGLDRAIALFRTGMAEGIVEPKLVVRNMIEQFDTLIAEGVANSTFMGPVKQFPAAIGAADRQRLSAAYTAQVRDVIQPAHKRMRDFLTTTYLPKARDTVGLYAIPGGKAYYTLAIEQSTTLPLTADAVHKLGLSEVARDLAEMEKQKAAAGFTGTLPEFFHFLRTDPRFQPKSAAAVEAGYKAIEARVLSRIPEQFSLVPKSPLEVRPVPAVTEKTAAAGSYQGGTPDGKRPGVFYYSAYDLPHRYTWGMENLFLHEGIPGHHFQISLAQEDTSLPAFIRFGGNTAYVEGWALYAETLYKPLGMETDPYSRMGGLNDDMLRAMRLVVDTGLHAQGWTRDRAIKYMLDNSPMPESDARAEVERYIAMPSQALAYKIGQLTILRAKAKAMAALGERFDPRAFHAAVLDTGALPMPVLEAKLDAWLAAQQRR